MSGFGSDRPRNDLWPQLALLVALALPRIAAAAEDYAGAWLAAALTDSFATANGTGRLRYWLDAGAKYPDLGSGASQYVVRPAIGYDVSGTLQAWVGYARGHTESGSGAVADENRYWQQLDWSAKSWNDRKLTLRLRLEERDVSIGDDVALVFRCRVQYARPLGSGSTNRLLLSLEPIFYLSDTDWAGNSGLKSNRAFIGVERPLSPRVSMTVGYLSAYVWSDTGADRMDHIAFIGFKAKP